MVSRTSRKKNKGKERKAKKEANRAEAERAEAHEVWWGWAIGQNNIDTITKCDHGCSVLPPKDHPVIRFVDDFFAQGISEESLMSVDTFLDRIKSVQGQSILNNESYKKMLIDIFMRIGICMLLDNELNGRTPPGTTQYGVVGALRMAKSIVILEHYNGADIGMVISSRSVASTLRDFNENSSFVSGRRDGLKFFSKRASCACLKTMHQEARKSIPKTGMCWHCKENRIERVALSVCSRCMILQYCSRECQVAHWPQHKVECDQFVKTHKQLTQAVDENDETKG